MECRLDLKDAEWQLVRGLLERERADLHTEIRHTDNREYRHTLHDRLDTIEGLLMKLHEQPVVS